MRTIDPIIHIRAHRSMYLPEGAEPSAYLANRLAGDAITLGASRIEVRRGGDWFTVVADADWMSGSGESDPCQLFSRVVPFVQAGPNAIRSEILLSAFARDLVTRNAFSTDVVRGQQDPRADALLPDWPWARSVQFRL